MDKQRFIEVDFPIREVSEESAREKNIRHGHISTLHIWWARRPLAASRATIYASLVPEPRGDKEREERKRFIAELCKWENSNNKALMEKARKDILEANGGVSPKVLDPFAGGGAIPLEALRRFLALESLVKSEEFEGQLPPSEARRLRDMHLQASKDLPSCILRAHRHLATFSPQGVRWWNLGVIIDLGKDTTFSFLVKEFLSEREMVVSRLSGKAILDKAFFPEEVEKTLVEVHEVFLRTPGAPLPESRTALAESVVAAVRQGSLGLQVGEEVFLHGEVPFVDLPDDALILRPKEARRRAGRASSLPLPEEEAEETPFPLPEEKALPKKGEETVRRVVVRATIRPEHLSGLISGVLNPLRSEGELSDVQVEVEAFSRKGFSRKTLDLKIRETLSQLGADFEVEEG